MKRKHVDTKDIINSPVTQHIWCIARIFFCCSRDSMVFFMYCTTPWRGPRFPLLSSILSAWCNWFTLKPDVGKDLNVIKWVNSHTFKCFCVREREQTYFSGQRETRARTHTVTHTHTHTHTQHAYVRLSCGLSSPIDNRMSGIWFGVVCLHICSVQNVS